MKLTVKGAAVIIAGIVLVAGYVIHDEQERRDEFAADQQARRVAAEQASAKADAEYKRAMAARQRLEDEARWDKAVAGICAGVGGGISMDCTSRENLEAATLTYAQHVLRVSKVPANLTETDHERILKLRETTSSEAGVGSNHVVTKLYELYNTNPVFGVVIMNGRIVSW